MTKTDGTYRVIETKVILRGWAQEPGVYETDSEALEALAKFVNSDSDEMITAARTIRVGRRKTVETELYTLWFAKAIGNDRGY